MIFNIVYFIFVVAYILYGNVIIGGIASPRALMAIIMFFLCFIEKERLKFDKYLILYLAFVFFYAFSSYNTGFFNDFLVRFFRQYFVSCVCFWSTYLYVKKSNKNVNLLMYVFMGVGLLNAFITIGQFSNASFSMDLMDFLGISIEEEFSDKAASAYDLSGYVLPGIFGQVTNGYYLSITCLFALYSRNGKIRWYNILMWLIIVYALFLCQERSAFFMGVLLSLFCFYKNMKDKLNIVFRMVVTTAVLLLLLNLRDFIMSGDTRYALGLDLTNRDFVLIRALAFIQDNLLQGGFHLYMQTNPFPHNLALNALIYGGLFGGIVILVLVFLQTIKVIKYIIRPMKQIDLAAFILGLAFLAFTANSIFHNLSVVSGEGVIWIIWAAFYFIGYGDKENKKQVSSKSKTNENSNNTIRLSR